MPGMVYDMKSFIESCVERSEELAGNKLQPYRKAGTPFLFESEGEPANDDNDDYYEPEFGVLADIALQVIMKVFLRR